MLIILMICFLSKTSQKKEIVEDFISGAFPSDLTKNINISTLEIDNNAYSDTELKKYFSDIVYNCKYNGFNIKIALLFEHKSFIPDFPFKQILKYIIKIWDYNEKQKTPLIPVIPIIFYHGKKDWEYKRLCEYLPGVDVVLRRYIPDFDYLLTDMTKYSDDKIIEIFHNELLKVFLLIVKNIFNEKKLKDNLEKFLNIGKIYYESEKGLDALESLISYLYNCMETVSVDDIVEVIQKISETGGEKSMTVPMKLRNEGKIEGKIEDAKKMLLKGLDVELILDVTGLSREEILKLSADTHR